MKHYYTQDIEQRAKQLYEAHMRKCGRGDEWARCSCKHVWHANAEREAQAEADQSNGLKPNVELTGAARPYRAASSDRRERG
jgi:hypothetical protein